MCPTVADVISAIERRYPVEQAEDWDAVGLTVGSATASVNSILFAVDATYDVAREAVEVGANLIIAHHPLLLRGIRAVDVGHPKGRVVAELLRHDVSLYVAHTNADVGPNGVVDALATALGLTDTRPLRPRASPQLDKIITFVPPAHVEKVRDALAAAGAGATGRYDQCAFINAGTSTFRPLAGSRPFLGRVNEIQRVDETRIEMVLARSHREAVVSALLAAHPYETPAYDVLELAAMPSEDTGLGRVGSLADELTLRQFAERVTSRLPRTAGGVRVSGDLDRRINRVAVQAGAGDDLLDVVRAAGADVYLTSDLRHHPASEAREWPDAPALIEVSHWAAEWTWVPVVQRLLTEDLAAEGLTVSSVVSSRCTDPWNHLF